MDNGIDENLLMVKTFDFVKILVLCALWSFPYYSIFFLYAKYNVIGFDYCFGLVIRWTLGGK